MKDTITDPTIDLKTPSKEPTKPNSKESLNDDLKKASSTPEFFDSVDWNKIDKDAASESIRLIIDLYKTFFGEPPTEAELVSLNTSLSHEIENLRILIKMRKSDEQIHNMNVLSLTVEPGNAQLYRSLAQTQKSLLDIQKQIDETIKNIKSYFESTLDNVQQPTSTDSDEQEDNNIKKFRGSKSFIASLNASKKETKEEISLF